ncbi:hypothetical protein [Lysinibacillus sp. FSL K6-4013]|uniref:hypothetical protein n=1 Tax=Lysinibacillus sp. FSL K6-4013 TaxID=2921504 RepID=UPI00315A00A6
MGLNIRNLKKGLEIKINKCIALLGEEYASLNYTIYFYENREKLLKEQKNKPDMKAEQYTQIFNGETETAGVTIGEMGRIKIFLFLFGDIKRDPNEIISLIGNLYHEIRHAWQNENKLFQIEEEISTIDGNLDSYLKLPSEKDAYRFQEEQMQKHGEKILEIFGFNLKFTYQLKPEIRKVIYP